MPMASRLLMAPAIMVAPPVIAIVGKTVLVTTSASPRAACLNRDLVEVRSFRASSYVASSFLSRFS